MEEKYINPALLVKEIQETIGFTPLNSKMSDIKPEPKDTPDLTMKDIEAPATPGIKKEYDEATKPETPTPRKRERKKTTATNNSDGAEGEDEEQGTPAKKGKGTPKKTGLPPLPTSFATACESDHLILRMKDDENKGWKEINDAWSAMTGLTLGGSTLKGRYYKIKANFVTMTDEHAKVLVSAKKTIEDRFEVEKWHKIADAIEASTGVKYPHTVVMKKFKELSKKPAAVEVVKDEEEED